MCVDIFLSRPRDQCPRDKDTLRGLLNNSNAGAPLLAGGLPASAARAWTEKKRGVYWAPHSKCSSSSVRAEKRCPLGQVIVTCASLGFWFSGAFLFISSYGDHRAPK